MSAEELLQIIIDRRSQIIQQHRQEKSFVKQHMLYESWQDHYAAAQVITEILKETNPSFTEPSL